MTAIGNRPFPQRASAAPDDITYFVNHDVGKTRLSQHFGKPLCPSSLFERGGWDLSNFN
jgi:hypothetical protein